MLALIFVIFIIILGIVFLNVAYNTFIYRQIDKLKWLKFAAVVLLVYGLVQGAFWASPYFYILPVLKPVSNFLDSVVEKFFSYVDYRIFIVWFICPLVIAWIVYLVKTGRVVFNIRKRFLKWEKNQLATEKTNQNKGNTSTNQEFKQGNDDIDKEVHFLDITTEKIKYHSILGLQRAYETAKRKGLIIDETAKGYVAVYSDGRGLQDLKVLFSENSISIKNLVGKPSLVFFDKEDTEVICIQDQFLRLKEGMNNG